MNNKYNDIKETALKLESLFNTSPEKYYYAGLIDDLTGINPALFQTYSLNFC